VDGVGSPTGRAGGVGVDGTAATGAPPGGTGATGVAFPDDITPKKLVNSPGDAASAGGGLAGASAGSGGASPEEAMSWATLKPTTSGDPSSDRSGSTRASSQIGKLVSPGRNSVTTAKPDGTVAVSRIRPLSAVDRRPSIARSAFTSSGPAASARCTMTTRFVCVSRALCVRMPSATATHLRSWYRASKVELVIRDA